MGLVCCKDRDPLLKHVGRVPGERGLETCLSQSRQVFGGGSSFWPFRVSVEIGP